MAGPFRHPPKDQRYIPLGRRPNLPARPNIPRTLPGRRHSPRFSPNSQLAQTYIQALVDNGEMTEDVQRYYLFELNKLDKEFRADSHEYTEIMLKIAKGQDKRLQIVRSLGKGGFANVVLWMWTPTDARKVSQKTGGC